MHAGPAAARAVCHPARPAVFLDAEPAVPVRLSLVPGGVAGRVRVSGRCQAPGREPRAEGLDRADEEEFGEEGARGRGAEL